jgi:DNA-binding cell septation regulator SpoVG
MIRDLHATPGTDADFERGLVAFLRFRYGDVLVDGVCVRRTLDGRIVLAWPERRDGAGRRHAIVRPASEAARVELERAVLAELAQQELDRGEDERQPYGGEERKS